MTDDITLFETASLELRSWDPAPFKIETVVTCELRGDVSTELDDCLIGGSIAPIDIRCLPGISVTGAPDLEM